jgi:hypothetical protein
MLLPRIWQQRGETFKAFEKRLVKAAADVARTQGFPVRAGPSTPAHAH